MSDGLILPDTWFTTMSDDDKTAWSLEHHLRKEFPDFTFKIVMNPFNIHINEDGADLEAIQKETDRWCDMSGKLKIIWDER